MAATDPQLGRRLPGLVRRSPLQLQSVCAHTTVVPTLAEAGPLRLDEVAESARRSAERGLGHVTSSEVDDWLADLQAAETSGDFLFAETTFITTAIAHQQCRPVSGP
jgi:hypothetical protein